MLRIGKETFLHIKKRLKATKYWQLSSIEQSSTYKNRRNMKNKWNTDEKSYFLVFKWPILIEPFKKNRRSKINKKYCTFLLYNCG